MIGELNNIGIGLVGYFHGVFIDLNESKFFISTVHTMFKARLLGRECRFRKFDKKKILHKVKK